MTAEKKNKKKKKRKRKFRKKDVNIATLTLNARKYVNPHTGWINILVPNVLRRGGGHSK